MPGGRLSRSNNYGLGVSTPFHTFRTGTSSYAHSTLSNIKYVVALSFKVNIVEKKNRYLTFKLWKKTQTNKHPKHRLSETNQQQMPV